MAVLYPDDSQLCITTSMIQYNIDTYPKTYQFLKNQLRRQVDLEIESKHRDFKQRYVEEGGVVEEGEVVEGDFEDQIENFDRHACDYRINTIVYIIIQNIEFWTQKYSQYDFTWQKNSIMSEKKKGRTKFGFVPEFHCQYLIFNIWDRFFNPTGRWSMFEAITKRNSEQLGYDKDWINNKLEKIGVPSRAFSESNINEKDEIAQFVEQLTELMVDEKLALISFAFNQSSKSTLKTQ